MHASTLADPAGKIIALLPTRNEEQGMNHRSLRDIHEAIDEDWSLRKKKKIKIPKPNIFFRPKKSKKPKKPKKPKTKSSSKSKSPKCEESIHVITATISVADDGKNIEKKIKKIAKKAGKALDELGYWTIFCTNQELVPVIVARRLTAGEDSDKRRLQSTTFNAFFYGETDDFSELEDAIDAGVVSTTIEDADKSITNASNVDASPIGSIQTRQRRSRRLSSPMSLTGFKNARSTLYMPYGIEDELEAANEEWRDLNIAAISPIPSTGIKNSASYHANKPHVSPSRAKFDILPFCPYRKFFFTKMM